MIFLPYFQSFPVAFGIAEVCSHGG
jgi:hypothetical protein